MKIKSLSRIDTHDTHGWYVRVKYKGHEHRKLFSDSKYGNKLSSLVAAKKFRDDLEIQLGKPRTERMVVAKNKRNSSGVIGVRRREFPAYEVQVSMKPGIAQKYIIPIVNNDEETAFQKACSLRNKLLHQSYNNNSKIEFK